MSEPPSPWKAFLSELYALLDEPIELHCIGGFAAVVGYDLPRSTSDLDYRTILPYDRMNKLQQLAGPGPALARKYKVYLQHTGVESIPENYDERLTELFRGYFKNLRLCIPDP